MPHPRPTPRLTGCSYLRLRAELFPYRWRYVPPPLLCHDVLEASLVEECRGHLAQDSGAVRHRLRRALPRSLLELPLHLQLGARTAQPPSPIVPPCAHSGGRSMAAVKGDKMPTHESCARCTRNGRGAVTGDYCLLSRLARAPSGAASCDRRL